MSHTPGPWGIVQVTIGLAIVGMRGTQGEPVAQLCGPFPDVERDNAALIAAAPELLGACKTALFVIDQIQAVETLAQESWNVGIAKDALEAALAKARGGGG
jgi:hypothetical protein